MFLFRLDFYVNVINFFRIKEKLYDLKVFDDDCKDV